MSRSAFGKVACSRVLRDDIRQEYQSVTCECGKFRVRCKMDSRVLLDCTVRNKAAHPIIPEECRKGRFGSHENCAAATVAAALT